MAIQLLPGQSRTAGIGQAVGTGLGQGLQLLLQDKMNRMTQKRQQGKTAQGLEVLGYSPEEASSLSGVDPKILSEILKSKQRSQAYQGLSALLGQQQGTPAEGQGLDQGVETAETGIQPGLGSKELMDVAKYTQRERIQKRREAQKDKQFAFNLNKKYMDRVSTNERNARTDLQNLNSQMDLVKTGKLIGPRANVFVDFIGDKLGLGELGKSALKNTESQVFEKLSVPYFRGLKEKFGARPTQWDAQQMQKGFPSLYQTKAGKKVIIEFMKHDAMSAVRENRIKNELLKKNVGIPPLDLQEKVGGQLSKWKDNEYVKLRKKMSQSLAEESGPKVSASKVGKGTTVKNKANGLIFISNGKNWELMFSDSEG